MIPYWHVPVLHFGALDVPVHLLAVVAGLAIAYLLFARQAQRQGLSQARADEFAFFAIVAGMFGAHIGYLLLSGGYSEWFQLLNPVAGAVTMPGLLFGWMALEWRLKTWGISGAEKLEWWNAGARAFPWAWMVVRTGCILSHDEAGRLTGSWLGVQYPDGTRHDLAVYEWLWAAVLAATPSAHPMVRLLVSYGVVRVGLHWLRLERHPLDLILAILIVLAGIWWTLRDFSSLTEGEPAA